VTSAVATTTTETDAAAESEVVLQAAAPDDVDLSLSSKSFVESDALVDVSSDCAAAAPTVNDYSRPAEFVNHATSPPALRDGEAAGSPRPAASGDVGPSTVAATTSDFSIHRGSSFDSSTQWSSTASVDTVQGVRHANVPHPASPVLLENDIPAATATTTMTSMSMEEDVQRRDDKLCSAAEVIEEPSPSCNSEQQERQQQQQPQQLPKEEDVQVQDFKAGS